LSKKDSAESIISGSPEEIAELMKSASHPARVRVLTLLLQGEKRFSQLMQSTGQSKTALANHLDQLVEKRLVERVSRGEYRLTSSGAELVKTTVRIYNNSAMKKEGREKRLLRSYAESFASGRRTITKKVEHVFSWLSYTSAMAASLKALGVSVDKIDVGGYSGYSFLVNVSEGIISPAGPTALSMRTWDEIVKGTESLGWILERYEYPHSYPMKEGNPTREEIEIARRLFIRIKKEIDEKERPVVLWGVFAPIYGVVNGYDGESYVTTESREGISTEKLLPFSDMRAPGHIDAFFFRNGMEANLKKAKVEALARALDFASGRTPIVDGFVAGPRAFDEWAETLMHLRRGDQDYMGNSYLGACVAEGHIMASEFLRRIANDFDRNTSQNLHGVVTLCNNSAKLMEEFSRLFPFKYQGEISLTHRKKGADILKKVAMLEEETVVKLRNTVKGIVSES
jgi:DNA-binding HxlR family transcriptional regulator